MIAVLNIQVTQFVRAASFISGGFEGIMCPHTLHSAAKAALLWREQLPSHLIVKNASEISF